MFGHANACKGSYVYSVNPVSGAYSYAWSVTGGTIVSGQGSSSVIVNWQSGGAKDVAVQVSNICGSSNIRTLNVSVDTGCVNILPAQGAFRANYHLTNFDTRGGIVQDTDSSYLFSGTGLNLLPAGVIARLNNAGACAMVKNLF